MTEKKILLSGAEEKFSSIAPIIATIQMCPNEADEDIQKLRTSLWHELCPGSPYEEYISEEIFQRILEVKRQRQILKSLLEEAFTRQTREVLQLSREPREGDAKMRQLFDRVISEARDAASMEELDRQLEPHGASLDIIQLRAYQAVANDVEKIQLRIDLLTKKLHQLQKSLREIQVRRRQDAMAL